MEADTLKRMRAANDADPGVYFTPDSLAAAMRANWAAIVNASDDGTPTETLAASIIQAAKEAERDA